MNKNTLIAVLLSSLVIVVTMIVNVKVLGPKQNQNAQKVEETAPVTEEKEIAAENILYVAEENSELQEERYTIETKKVIVEFTNKGGDIISYKLKEHLDKETQEGVEMVDNVTEKNRAFSMTLGNELNPVLSDYFNVKKIDDYTIGFYKSYEVDGNKVVIGKRYSFKEDDYLFKLDITLNSEEEGKNINLNGDSYSIRTSPQIGPHYNKKDRYDSRQVITYTGNKAARKPIATKIYKNSYEWAGVAGKYFTTLVKPVSPLTMEAYVNCSNEEINGYSNSQIFLTRKADDNKNINDSYYVYIGPRSESELIKYNSQDKNSWNLSGLKFNNALQTSGLFSWIEIALKWSLEMIYKLLQKMNIANWGTAIIILTILLKLILFPVNQKFAMSSIKMQEIQPKVKELQDKYKNDQQKLSMEMNKLYKESGYSPLGGCLPMIFQFVILISLFNVFNNYFEFRGASFIKGWIEDLSVGDSVWSWKKQIPLISAFTGNHIRILPFLYTIFQIVNGAITQHAAKQNGQENTENPGMSASMKYMNYFLPLIFFFMFYNVPSGLLLYWSLSNFLQLGQQLLINHQTKKKRMELEANKVVVNKNVAKFKGGMKKTR